MPGIPPLFYGGLFYGVLRRMLPGETGGLCEGVVDGAVFLKVDVKQVNPVICLVSIDDDFVVDLGDLGRAVLPDTPNGDLYAPKIELEYGNDPFRSLENAG